MKHYPINRNSMNPRILQPLNCSYSEEYILDHYDLHLTEEYSRDDFGNVKRAYRLHSKKPHTVDMALAYDIHCPHCSTNLLKQVGRCLNHYDLGLYKCPLCDKE